MGKRQPARILTAGLGCLAILALSGCVGGGSARDDYYSARSIQFGADAGDGSVVAFGPAGDASTHAATLTFMPVGDGGDLADGR